MNIDLKKYNREGLYLYFPSGETIDIVKEDIEKLADSFWNDSSKLTQDMKKATEMQLCDHCPAKGESILCCALKPLLPFVESIDKYLSVDRVTAIYVDKEPQILHVSQTTMSDALKFLSILSVIYYCETGERYHYYYNGIIPLMPVNEIAERIYSNIYIYNKGDASRMEKTIQALKSDVLESSRCLVDRLRVICKNDSLANAFVNAQVISEFVDIIFMKTNLSE